MIKALLIESDARNRDIVTVGLEQFQAFEIDHAEDSWGVDMARDKPYDLILVNVDLSGEVDGLTVIKNIREFDQTAEAILLTRGKASRLLSREKAANNIFSLVAMPLAEESFFKTIARVKDRIEAKGKPRS